MTEDIKFTHTGIFCGLIPVLIRNPRGECLLKTRYFIPNCTIDVVASIYEFIANTVGNYDGWPITITGEIK